MRIPIFHRHIVDDLAAYDERRLDARGAARVDRHLAGCAPCREALADLRHGRALLDVLQPVAMPANQVARLEARLRHAAPRPTRRRAVIALASAAAIVAAVAGVLALRPMIGLGLDLRRSGSPVGLARVANEVHERIASGSIALDVRTSDAAAIRTWQRARHVPEMPIVSRAVGRGEPALTLRGAAIATMDDLDVSIVAYDIGGRRATVVAAAEDAVQPAPPRAWLRKRVYLHEPAAGRPVLTWSSSGETFAVVSDLPGAGQAACAVCHTSPIFRRTVDAAVARLVH